MTWLALRLLRPYLIVAVTVTAAATAYVLYGATVVQGQLDAAGMPDCLDPNFCYPAGAALDAVFGMELVAAFVPPLLGLVLGVALFAREREHNTIAFALTQSVSRRRWVYVKFGWALAAGLACTATVASAHRLVATRYTVLANDTYELLYPLHLNNIGYMVAQTLLLVALAGVVGLSTGRTLQTLVLSALTGPVAWLVTAGVSVLCMYAVFLLTGGTDTTTGDGGFADDISMMDPFAYLVGAVAIIAATALVLLAPRVRGRDT
ncbi:hypothetical protein AB0M36_02005 [Actinoplanes sp. NPDC051346]|uniref:hypothetical protein n=1 Tax=Actinoplanes sp. NPDC051346 TaxID=3155048 RepID=UPI003441BC01